MQQHAASSRRFGFTAGAGWNREAFGDFSVRNLDPHGYTGASQVSV